MFRSFVDAHLSPQDAAGYFTQLDDSRKTEHAQTLAKSWASSDPEKAIEWIGSLEDDSTKDAAISGMVDTYISKDADQTFDWIRQIKSSAVKVSRLKDVIESWGSTSPDLIRANLVQMNLSLGDLETLRNSIPMEQYLVLP